MSAEGMTRAIIATQLLDMATPETLPIMVDVLIGVASAMGKVVTITCAPKQPLAMRNYEMVADIRDAR